MGGWPRRRWPRREAPELSSRCHLPIFCVPVQELRTSLEKQRAQNSRLSVALEDEQTAKDNLRKELQIESSRCEALLAQERGRLSELRRGLQAEQGRTRELSEALQHERLLTEQLSRRTQACAHPAAPASPALLQQLQDEKARGAELQAALEEAQQHTAQARELEAEARARCEELRREKEVSATPRSPEQAPPSGDQGREGDSPAWLQAEVEQLQSRLAEQGGRKDSRRRAGTRQSRADADPWRKWQRDKEKLVRAAPADAARGPSSSMAGATPAGARSGLAFQFRRQHRRLVPRGFGVSRSRPPLGSSAWRGRGVPAVHTSFIRGSLFGFCKKAAGTSEGIAPTVHCCGSVVARTVRPCFRSSFISFIDVLQLSDDRLSTSLDKFIPQYFVIFDAVVNGIIFLVPFSSRSLLVRSSQSTCMSSPCSATQRHFIGSSIFVGFFGISHARHPVVCRMRGSASSFSVCCLYFLFLPDRPG